MPNHSAYWRGLPHRGTAVVCGPVADPAGAWGLAVVEAGTADEVRGFGTAGRAVASGLSAVEAYAMPGAVVRPWPQAGPAAEGG